MSSSHWDEIHQQYLQFCSENQEQCDESDRLEAEYRAATQEVYRAHLRGDAKAKAEHARAAAEVMDRKATHCLTYGKERGADYCRELAKEHRKFAAKIDAAANVQLTLFDHEEVTG